MLVKNENLLTFHDEIWILLTYAREVAHISELYDE